MKPNTKIGKLMQDTLAYLIARKERLERNLLNAVDEPTAIAIYEMVMNVNNRIFNFK
jgi:hypothetical protein